MLKVNYLIQEIMHLISLTVLYFLERGKQLQYFMQSLMHMVKRQFYSYPWLYALIKRKI